MRTTVKPRGVCTGCGACVSVCPRGAVRMERDAEGFLYPAVDPALCVGCDLCEKRCPAGTAFPGEPSAFRGYNTKEEVRARSSSGGVFSALAERTLKKGGAVFGAVFSEGFAVEHVGAVSRDGVLPMLGSKYVQSSAADALRDAARLLGRDTPVLFSGTPCQIAGLYALLGEARPERLLTVDFVCHGVPSPGVFASYLDWLEREHGAAVEAYSFRDKRRGWKDFSAAARFGDGREYAAAQTEDPFLLGFLRNLYLRPSCHACTALRHGGHAADVTLADLWGARELWPEEDDDRGLSLVFANTDKGRGALRECPELTLREIGDVRRLARANPSIFAPAPAHAERARFFRGFSRRGFSPELVARCLRESRAKRLKRRLLGLAGSLKRRLGARAGR